MKRLLIVYHSQTGHTRQLAEVAARGAGHESGVDVRLVRAFDAGIDDLLACDALLIGTPENLGYMCGAVKDFFDRTYYAALDRINGRPYAAMICAGSDGQNAARQVERIALGWRLQPIAPPLIVITHAQAPEAILAQKTICAADLDRCTELGLTLASGLALGVF